MAPLKQVSKALTRVSERCRSPGAVRCEVRLMVGRRDCTRSIPRSYRNHCRKLISVAAAPVAAQHAETLEAASCRDGVAWPQGHVVSHHSLASRTAFGSATFTLPVPTTAIAFRFLDPKTPPKPPCPAPEPPPCTSDAMRVLFSPAGPIVTMAGLWVCSHFPVSAIRRRSGPERGRSLFQISSCVSQVVSPQSDLASSSVTLSSTMLM